MTLKKQVERYALEASPFHRMGRAIDLAGLLGVSQKQLRELIVRRIALYNFKEVCINGKNRSLSVPINEMRRVQERIKDLLGRIMLRPYLYSPRRGRSPVDNAVAHLNARIIVKLDVKQFYPSTTDEHVFQFFHHRLGMADDVAGRITKLCTINGKVPFGSPLSPILCALVHDDIFSRAATWCQLDGETMSLWVDDLTISGDDVSGRLLRNIRRLIASKRLRPHKTQRVRGRRGAVITGTFIGRNGPAPGNKLHLSMIEKLRELENATSDESRLGLTRSLIGLVNYFITVYPKDSEENTRLRGRLTWLHNLRRDLESNVILTAARVRLAIVSDDVVPWN